MDIADKVKEVEEAIGARDMPRAIALSCAALMQGKEHPLFLNIRAYDHENGGRHEQALYDLLRATQLAPDDVVVLNALGLAYARVGHFVEAVQVFDGVIARQPRFWQAYYNRGWTSEEAGELKAARLYFERAIALAPNAPDPMARLGAVAVRTGDWATAREYAQKTLAINPRFDIALATMASVDLHEKNYDSAETRIRAVIEDTQNLPHHRSHAWGVLAEVMDRQDRIPEAFAAYTAHNEILREYYTPQYDAPGVETILDVYAWLTDIFTRIGPDAFALDQIGQASGQDVLGHIFMTGFPRSGTTLLEEVLASSPEVVTTQERDGLLEPVRKLFNSPQDVEFLLPSLRGAALSRERRSYWNAVASFGIDVKGKILLDKLPYHTVKLPLIAKLFPSAKILFCLRDPRDVVLSCFRRSFRMNPTNFQLLTLEGTARLYDKTMHLADLYRQKLPLDLIEVRHETLVDNFEPEVRRICDFVGLPWDDAMRDFANRSNRRAITTPSALQITRGLNREGMGSWRRYKDQMAPVLPILQPWVERWGYDPE
jgi:Flp pilus assembly protein TadD